MREMLRFPRTAFFVVGNRLFTGILVRATVMNHRVFRPYCVGTLGPSYERQGPSSLPFALTEGSSLCCSDKYRSLRMRAVRRYDTDPVTKTPNETALGRVRAHITGDPG